MHKQNLSPVANISPEQASLDRLERVVGTDPVVATYNKEADTIPSNGWLVQAFLMPLGEGVILIRRYDSLTVTRLEESQSPHQIITARALLSCTGEHVLAYECPTYATPTVEPKRRQSMTDYLDRGFDGLDIHPTSDGGRLLDQRESYTPKEITRTELAYEEVSEDAFQDGIQINRVTDDARVLYAILGQLSCAMGMSVLDAKTSSARIINKLVSSNSGQTSPEETTYTNPINNR